MPFSFCNDVENRLLNPSTLVRYIFRYWNSETKPVSEKYNQNSTTKKTGGKQNQSFINGTKIVHEQKKLITYFHKSSATFICTNNRLHADKSLANYVFIFYYLFLRHVNIIIFLHPQKLWFWCPFIRKRKRIAWVAWHEFAFSYHFTKLAKVFPHWSRISMIWTPIIPGHNVNHKSKSLPNFFLLLKPHVPSN